MLNTCLCTWVSGVERGHMCDVCGSESGVQLQTVVVEGQLEGRVGHWEARQGWFGSQGVREGQQVRHAETGVHRQALDSQLNQHWNTGQQVNQRIYTQ